MPPKKICSDKAPLNKREWSVSTCYKKGIRAGFVAGIQKAQKQAQQGAQAQENALMAINDVNIAPPRVKPAGRKQKFAAYYNFPLRAAVVDVNPVAAAEDTRPSIRQIIRDVLRGRKSQAQIDILISNNYFPVPELTRNQKKALKTTGMIQYLKTVKGYRD